MQIQREDGTGGRRPAPQRASAKRRGARQSSRAAAPSPARAAATGSRRQDEGKPVRRNQPKVGRNDLVPAAAEKNTRSATAP